MIWNPGDDTDLNEGGDGVDTVEVNGGNGAEQFTATANGARVRFDRVNPAPFSIDIGTSEKLVLNANGGDDSFSATGNLAALIKITVDGGAGNDTLLGSNGADVLLGGDGNDFVDGNQGNDTALLGAGDDTFQWDPGDGSDTVEGQDGTDTMLFNGSNVSENFDASANGGRRALHPQRRQHRDGPQRRRGHRPERPRRRRHHHRQRPLRDRRRQRGGRPGAAAEATTASPTTSSSTRTQRRRRRDASPARGSTAQVAGLSALVSVSGAERRHDRLTVNALAGDDVIDASGVGADSILLTLDGGDGDDVLIGGAGDDVLHGGPGDDVLIGGPGNDVIDGGPGDNVVIDTFAANTVTSATRAGKGWLATHVHIVNGKTVIEAGSTKHVLPRADLSQLVRDAASR